MTVPILGELALNRKPLVGRLADAVHSLTMDFSTSEVGQVEIVFIDRNLRMLASNQLVRGHEITWTVGGFTRQMVIAVLEVSGSNDVEMVKVTCRPAAVENLRNFIGAAVWSGQSPTEWLANECLSAVKESGTAIDFVGQPTMTRTQIVRRAEQGKPPETSWDVAGSLASEEGFWLFENAGTVYFGSPSWLAVERGGDLRDVWTWPRPASGRTPLLKVPQCRVSDYAIKASLQPATIDGTVPMEYALGLAPGQTIRVEIPQFRGRYLVTKVTVSAGEPTATVGLQSPVDPEPHTALVTAGNLSQAGFDPETTGLTGVMVGAYFYNWMVSSGFTPTFENVSIAIAIANAESSFVTTNHNDVPPDDSWGLWQINVLGGIHGEVKTRWESLTHSSLPDWPSSLQRPDVNAFGAVLISGGGRNWKPWTTFTRGTYTRYLSDAQVSAARVFELSRGPNGLLAVPSPPTSRGDGISAASTNATVERFVQFALSKRGSKYVLGTAGENGTYDCSGLIYAALTSIGAKRPIPRTARALYEWCRAYPSLISTNAAKQIRGAVMFRVDSGATNHCVISLGDGFHTIEAMGDAYGVVQGNIGNRFDHAGLLPALDYPQNAWTLTP